MADDGGPRAVAIERGKELRKMRRRLSLSLAQLAELIDAAPSTISYYESGRYPPSGTRNRILNALREALKHHPPHIVFPRKLMSVEERLILIFQLAQGPAK